MDTIILPLVIGMIVFLLMQKILSNIDIYQEINRLHHIIEEEILLDDIDKDAVEDRLTKIQNMAKDFKTGTGKINSLIDELYFKLSFISVKQGGTMFSRDDSMDSLYILASAILSTILSLRLNYKMHSGVKPSPVQYVDVHYTMPTGYRH